MGKGEIAHYELIMSNFSFSYGVLKKLILQIHKNQGFFGIGLS